MAYIQIHTFYMHYNMKIEIETKSLWKSLNDPDPQLKKGLRTQVARIDINI